MLGFSDVYTRPEIAPRQTTYYIGIPPEEEYLQQTTKTFPLIIFLHGMAQSTKSSAMQKSSFFNLYGASESFRKEFITVCPISPSKSDNHYWFRKGDWNGELDYDLIQWVQRLVEKVCNDPGLRVDKSRVTLAGVSMGAAGAIDFLIQSSANITAAMLLAPHFPGTLDPTFMQKTKDSNFNKTLKKKDVDQLLENLKSREIRLWILHSKDDMSCPYFDTQSVHNYFAKQGYKFALTNGGIKKHMGPDNVIFGLGNKTPHPHPLAVFGAHPEKYDDNRDWNPIPGDLSEPDVYQTDYEEYKPPSRNVDLAMLMRPEYSRKKGGDKREKLAEKVFNPASSPLTHPGPQIPAISRNDENKPSKKKRGLQVSNPITFYPLTMIEEVPYFTENNFPALSSGKPHHDHVRPPLAACELLPVNKSSCPKKSVSKNNRPVAQAMNPPIKSAKSAKSAPVISIYPMTSQAQTPSISSFSSPSGVIGRHLLTAPDNFHSHPTTSKATSPTAPSAPTPSSKDQAALPRAKSKRQSKQRSSKSHPSSSRFSSLSEPKDGAVGADADGAVGQDGQDAVADVDADADGEGRGSRGSWGRSEPKVAALHPKRKSYEHGQNIWKQHKRRSGNRKWPKYDEDHGGSGWKNEKYVEKGK